MTLQTIVLASVYACLIPFVLHVAAQILADWSEYNIHYVELGLDKLNNTYTQE
jgi:hypothetical protein